MFLHASLVVVTHLLFYKDVSTSSRYLGYQQILARSQQILMSGFNLNSTTDFQILMGSLRVFLICKVTMDLGSTDSSVG